MSEEIENVNKLPETVNIGGIIYKVIEVDDLRKGKKKLNGSICFDSTTISIEKNISDQLKIVTLWHEVIHGIVVQSRVDCNEKTVEVLGFGIVGFIQLNEFIIKVQP